MKLYFLGRFSKKCSNIKFHENLSNGSRVVSYGQMDGRTDGHDEALRNVSKAPNDITGIGWEGMDWIDVAQDKDKWRVVVKMVLNLRVTQNTGNVLPG
jgi:hypothetical protein